MKRLIGWLAWPAVLLVAAGCGPRNSFQPPPPPEVSVAAPLVEDVTVYRTYPGRLEAVEFIEVRARVRGYLQQAAFEDGALVEKGKLLFVIEPEPFEATLKSAEARLSQARAGFSLAETSLERKKQASALQAVSELDVLAAEADLESAQAAIQAAESAVENARIDLSYTTLHSPIAGRADRHYVSVGNLVGGVEATLLTTVVSQDPIYCYFNVDERSYLLFRSKFGGVEETEGAPPAVKLELADGSVWEHEGVVDYVDNIVDPATGTLNMRARLPNPDGILAPGLFGKIMVPVLYKEAMLVPALAVQRDMVGSYVLVVDEQGLVDSRYLELGPRHDDRRIVLSGLEAGERVVIKGLQRARPGITVQAVPDSEKGS